MFCVACGHSIRKGLFFCEECGEPVSVLQDDTVEEAPKKNPAFMASATNPLGNPTTSWLGKTSSWSVGSDPGCDLCLPYSGIEPFHATLIFERDTYYLQDQSSHAGLFYPDLCTKVTRLELTTEMLVFLGTSPVSGRRIILKKTWLEQKSLKPIYFQDEVVFGSSDRCQAFIADPDVRPRHARAWFDGNQYWIESIAQSKVIFEGQALVGKGALTSGSELCIGSQIYYFDRRAFWPQKLWKKYRIELKEVSLNVVNEGLNKTLLHKVSFSIGSGELCAVMGMSGAGKTTLLKCMNGYLKPTSGKVLVNGISLHENYEYFKINLGYVPQENIFHKDLTVYQALYFSAKLRLGETISEEGVNQKIDHILNLLDMYSSNENICSTKIANLSGGQKRLLSIGIELLIDPSIFILDEPLSGLSSEDARKIFNVLERLAQEGRIVLLTIHQPSQEIYEKFDLVIYLHRGGFLAYAGPSMPDSYSYVQQGAENPVAIRSPEVVLSVFETRKATFWNKYYLQSPYHQEFVVNRSGQILDLEKSEPKRMKFSTRLYQTLTLLKRDLAIRLQDQVNTGVLLAQSPIIGILIVMAFSHTNEIKDFQVSAKVLYLLSITSIWFGCSNSARDVCGEWNVYQRERMFNLDLWAYLISKSTTASLIGFIQCVLLLLLVRGPCGLESSFFRLLSVTFLASLAGGCLGICISAFSAPFKKSNEIAMGLIPLVLLPMVILGGLIKPHKEMNEVTRFLSDLTVTRWAFQSMLAAESKAMDQTDKIVGLPLFESTAPPKVKGIIVKAFFNSDNVYDASSGLIRVLFMAFIFIYGAKSFLRARDLIR